MVKGRNTEKGKEKGVEDGDGEGRGGGGGREKEEKVWGTAPTGTLYLS